MARHVLEQKSALRYLLKSFYRSLNVGRGAELTDFTVPVSRNPITFGQNPSTGRVCGETLVCLSPVTCFTSSASPPWPAPPICCLALVLGEIINM